MTGLFALYSEDSGGCDGGSGGRKKWQRFSVEATFGGKWQLQANGAPTKKRRIRRRISGVKTQSDTLSLLLSLFVGTTVQNNQDVGAEPLTHPFPRSLALLTPFLAPHWPTASLARAFHCAHLFANSLTHSQARGKGNH